MSERTDQLKAAGMQFPNGVLSKMETLLDEKSLSQASFDNLVNYTKTLTPSPPDPNAGVALAYIAFQFRSGKE
jgi:hypothetical protein